MSRAVGTPEQRDHRAVVYGDDVALVETVAPYLAAALGAGGSAIAVAKWPHRSAIEDWMALAGVDVAGATRAARYQCLDAEEVLSAFERHESAADGLLAWIEGCLRAVSTERPVHVFGELVGDLYGAGRYSCIDKLEHAGTALAARPATAILCAYPSRNLVGPLDASPVVLHHGEVSRLTDGDSPSSPPLLASRSFPPTIHGCRAARRLVASLLADRLPPGVAADAAVVVDELAANAMRHVGGPFRISVAAIEGAVRVSVRDVDTTRTDLRAELPRGLGIVNGLARDWGIDVCASGKELWATLDPCAGEDGA